MKIDLITRSGEYITSIRLDDSNLSDEFVRLRSYLKNRKDGLEAYTMIIHAHNDRYLIDETLTNALRSFGGFFWAQKEILSLIQNH